MRAKAEKPFAVMHFVVEGLDVFEAEMANAKVMSWGYGTTTEKALAQAPYRWGQSDAQSGAINTAEVVGKQLVGKKAEYAGSDELKGQTRKFGIVYIPNLIDIDGFEDEFAKYKGKITVDSPYEGNGATFGDPTVSQAAAPLAVSKMKQAGVTTVILFSDVSMTTAVMEEATKQEWYPEWFFTGAVYHDIGVLARTYPTEQSKQAFGISFLCPVPQPDDLTEQTRPITVVLGSRTARTDAASVGSQLLWFLSGVHTAGPKLTPKTFQQGIFSIPATGGAATDEPGRVDDGLRHATPVCPTTSTRARASTTRRGGGTPTSSVPGERAAAVTARAWAGTSTARKRYKATDVAEEAVRLVHRRTARSSSSTPGRCRSSTWATAPPARRPPDRRRARPTPRASSPRWGRVDQRPGDRHDGPVGDLAEFLGDIKVIDVDTHLTEPHDLWTHRAPKGWEERLPHVRDVDGARPVWIDDGNSRQRGRRRGDPARRDQGRRPRVHRASHIDDVHPAAYDVDAQRIEIMDDDGRARGDRVPERRRVRRSEVQRRRSIPSCGMLCATIFNDAMAEIQERSSQRMFPMAIVPWWDIDGSVREIERCHVMGCAG